MKKYKLAILCMASATAISAQNAITSTGVEGFLARGIQMYDNENYNGCIDQMSEARALDISKSFAETADYYIALSKYNRGDSECLSLLEKFLSDYPASTLRQSVLYTIGNYHFYKDRFDEALTRYEQVPETAFDGQRASELIYRKSFCYIRQKDYDKARRGFNKLKGKSKYNDLANYYLAVIDYSEGNYDEAESGFQRVSKKSSLYSEAQFYLCQIAFHKSDYTSVQAAGNALLAKNLPAEMTAELNRIIGESEYHLGNTERAVQLLNAYLQLTEQEPERSALYILGVCHFRNGDYSETLRYLGDVTDGDDALAQSAYLYVGQAYLREDNVDAASLAFEKAYKMPYDQAVRETAFYNYAIAQSRGGRTPFVGSINLFRDFLNTFPNSQYASDVEDYIINSFYTKKDYDNALVSINSINKPSDKMLAAKQNVLYRLGMREMGNGNTKAALDYLTQADKLSYDKSVSNETALWLGEAYYADGQYAKSQTMYARYIRNTGGRSDNAAKANYGLGYALFQQRKYADARTAFASAMNGNALSPQLKADTYCRIGDCYYYGRDFANAGSYYDKALSQNTANADYALFQKGMMQGLTGNQSEKISIMDRLTDKFPSSAYSAKAVYEKSQALVASGKNEEAVRTFKQLASNYPQTAEARQGLLQMALLLNNMGRNKEAKTQYETLVRNYPSSSEARLAIEDLKRIYADEGNLAGLSTFLREAGSNYELNENEMARLSFESAENEYLASGKTERIHDFLKKYPNSSYTAQASFYLAEAANIAGNDEAALDYATRALDKAPDAGFAESALGIKADQLLKQDRYQEAAAAYTKMESIAASSFSKQRAQVGRLRAAVGLEDNGQIIELSDKLLATDGLSSDLRAEFLFARAKALRGKGETKKAVADLSTLVNNHVETLHGSMAAIELAEYYYKNGDYSSAEKTVNKLVDSATPHQYWMARGFIMLSDIYKKQGDKFQAREYLQSLKSNYPGHEADIFDMIETRLKDLK